ncbi:hypothetical protein T492DRAFT_885676 [Pavlovales sp. CCMP2436]|nr:hypothetical protein T492DRAFT_885676 [Pavlovales sp. CCMP2436]
MGAPLIAHAFLPPLTPFNVGVTALQIAGVVSMGMSEKPTCPRAVLVGTMLTAHYLKREFEVLWLHSYRPFGGRGFGPRSELAC